MTYLANVGQDYPVDGPLVLKQIIASIFGRRIRASQVAPADTPPAKTSALVSSFDADLAAGKDVVDLLAAIGSAQANSPDEFNSESDPVEATARIGHEDRWTRVRGLKQSPDFVALEAVLLEIVEAEESATEWQGRVAPAASVNSPFCIEDSSGATMKSPF